MPEIGRGFENVYSSDCQALHELLGLPDGLIESPSSAPSTVRLDKLWNQTPSGLSVPFDREIFLGFDFDQNEQKIICTESTLGNEDTFATNSSDHLVWFHTEPAQKLEDLNLSIGPIKLHSVGERELFAQNFPSPYWGDMVEMLKNSSIYSSIIVRLAPEGNLHAALIAIKTKQFKSESFKLFLRQFKHGVLDEKHPIAQALSDDEFVTKECGIAIYRGFIQIPPTNDDVLRIRKFS